MEYRGVTVAAKHFETSVTPKSVLWEASVINQLDHPGNDKYDIKYLHNFSHMKVTCDLFSDSSLL
jgi:hypothetical protein